MGEPIFDRLAALSPRILLPAAMAVFSALSITGMVGTSSTFDEGSHLASGYSILTRGDFRMDPIGPPLVKSLAALPLLLQEVRTPKDAEAWEGGRYFDYGFQFLYGSGNDPELLLSSGRLMILLLALALLPAAYFLARELHGPRGALITLVLATFSPNLLAHSHLVTLDLGFTLFCLLSVGAFTLLSRRVSWPRVLACGASLGLALSAKLSALILVPALTAATAAYLLAGGGWTFSKGASVFARPGRAGRWQSACLMLLVIGSLSLIVLWAAHGFRYRISPDPSFSAGWETLPWRSEALRAGTEAARKLRLLPEAYLHGIAQLQQVTQEEFSGRTSYALGAHSPNGWWWYFPLAFLVKTPPAALIFYLLGFYVLLRGGRSLWRGHAYLLAALLLFAVLSLMSKYDVGIRHILPLYPLLMVLAGSSHAVLPRGNVLAVLLACAAASGLLAARHPLAYFNSPSTALADRHLLLAESNLDWGQDLPGLKRWMESNGVPEIKLAYFGSASPRHHGIDHQVLPGYHLYTRYEAEFRRARDILPGDLVALSATNLRGVYLPRKDIYRLFWDLEPLAAIGHSILIYRIP